MDHLWKSYGAGIQVLGYTFSRLTAEAYSCPGISCDIAPVSTYNPRCSPHQQLGLFGIVSFLH